MEQKRKSNFVEDEIMLMVEEVEASQHVSVGGLGIVA